LSRSKRASPTLVGVFVLGALALAVAGLVVFGSGKLFRRTERFVAVFSGSVNGLSVGAPVKFRGVQVGSVSQILLGLPGMTLPELRIPILIDIDQTTARRLGAMVNPADPVTLAALIDQGLRAQLQLESIVTGVLFVQLDLFPNTPATFYLPPNSGYLEIPTQPTLLQEASQTAADLVAKLRDIDFEGVATSIRDAARGVSTLTDSPELRQALTAVREAMVDARATLATANHTLVDLKPRIGPFVGRVDGGVAQLQKTLERLNQTLGVFETTLTGFNTLTDPRAPLVYQATNTLAELSDAARSVRQLADYLDRNPNAILTGRPAK
jgi:phospholipid/cholesterol/gamma-HCH transport system substrate-binding protein